MTPARAAVIVAIALLAAGCGGAPPPERGGDRPAGERGRVIVISIDGLKPETYLEPDRHGLAVPALRAMAARGAFARVTGVFPTVTYPSHTTMVTGVPPAVHGIVTNKPPDPLDVNHGGWRWYSEDIAVPTLWQVVEADRRRAALVTWPVTVGANATFVVPEYWRAGGRDDQKLLRALSTPGLLERVAGEFPELWQHLVPPDVHDQAQFAIARYLIGREQVDLLLVHAWALDDAQHAHAPWSREALAAAEAVDRLLGELLAASERAPQWSRTTFVVVSDHGFAPIDHEIRLNALFAKHGLIQLDANGKTTAARASAVAQGGSAFVYLADPAAREGVDRALAEVAGLIARVYPHDEVVALGGDPAAALVVAAIPSYQFDDQRVGPIVVDTPGQGTHGSPPSDPAMMASFIAVGPRVPHRDLGTIRMIDIAPTLARWLGVALPAATGTPLPL